MKILYLGDSPTVSTGFSKITREICNRLHKKDDYDVTILGINHFGSTHNYPYPIYSCFDPTDNGNDQYGVTRLPKLIDRLKLDSSDIVILQNDPWNIKPYFDSIDYYNKQRAKFNIEPIKLPIIIAFLAVDACNQKGYQLNDDRLSGVMVWTKFAGNELEKGGYGKGWYIVPLGVDTNIYHPYDRDKSRDVTCPKIIANSNNPFIVGVVGRNQPRKKIDLAIEYFAKWIHSYNINDAYLYLHVAPTGEVSCDIQQLIRYYDISGRVILNEPQPGIGIEENSMLHFYNSFDVLLIPSIAEGWSLPALESMACGIPVIAGNHSALGDEGWTVIENDYNGRTKRSSAVLSVKCSSTCLSAPLGAKPYTIGKVLDKDATVEAINLMYETRNLDASLYGGWLDYNNRGLELSKQLSWDNTFNKFEESLKSIVANKANSELEEVAV